MCLGKPWQRRPGAGGVPPALHRREVIQAQKKNAKPKVYSAAEEQVSYLNKLFWIMAVLLVLATALLGVFTFMLIMP